ncbi:MAG: rhodanese-like domain-containing protein, partial [Verrucomicrobiales bacterium]
MKTILAHDLATLLNQTQPLRLIDVRLAEDFESSHISSAVNNCVFEIAFLERMPEIAPDLATPLCLYGAAEGSLESRMATDKLARAGYTELVDFRGGLAAWLEAGLPVEGSDSATVAPVVPDGVYRVDLTESRIEWLGRNLINKHWGT